MPIQAWIWIAGAISVAGFAVSGWLVLNARGYQARGDARAREREADATRRGDRRKLSRHERGLYDNAQKLIAQKKFVPASQILEQIGMAREAIHALETAGLIHDAAKILMRMQRHNRAGVIYARHGMWDRAAQCFKMANMPLEVAKCLREAGDLLQAGIQFEKAGRMEEAAECFSESGNFQKAGRIFISIGAREKAIDLYRKAANGSSNPASIELDRDELRLIVEFLGHGHYTDSKLIDVVVSKNKLTDVISALVSRNMVAQATDLFQRAGSDLGMVLMAEVSYADGSAEALGQVFMNANAYLYAGMVFERLQAFPQAGQAFESAEDFERASYCYERAKLDKKARLMKEKAMVAPKRKVNVPSGFALADVPSTGPSGVPEMALAEQDKTTFVAIPPPEERAESEDRVPPGQDEGENSADAMEEADSVAASQSPIKDAPSAPLTLVKPEPAARIGRFSLAADDEEEHALDSSRSETPAVSGAQPVVSQFDASEPTLAGDKEKRHGFPLSAEEGRQVFHRSTFVADLDADQKDKCWTIGRTLTFDSEQPILTFNDEPLGIYIVLCGLVKCFRLQSGKEFYIDQMDAAESFGELWLLAGHPSAVKFVAAKGTQIRVIERAPFNELLDRDGTIARKVYKRFTMRLLKRLLRSQNHMQNRTAS